MDLTNFREIMLALFCRFGKSVYLCTQKTSRDGAVVARWAHNPKVAGSSPAPATRFKVVFCDNLFFCCIKSLFLCHDKIRTTS